ncbi:MAG: SufD family Fe-S cluster assembly protein [Bdellovibrionota bacterium]
MNEVKTTAELLPSRKDENYRYTQIAIDVTDSKDWDSEKLAHTLKSESTFTPWSNDYYLKALEGVANLNITAPKSEEWIFLHSQGEASKIRGSAELIVPKGKHYKVFEFLEQSAEKSLFMRNVKVAEGASVEYFFLQKQNLSNTFVARHFFDLAEGAKATFRFYHAGAKKGQHRIASRVEKNASFTLEGANRLRNAQHVDIWAESEHVGATSLSNTTVWNVLTDESVAVFNGMIRILKDCPQTLAYQSNKTLMLSEKARIYTLPKLEISTDDVKCSHGASVSSLDESQLFYLQSRGIDKESGEKMLVEAFTQPVLQHLPKHLISEALQKELHVLEEQNAF